jgi:uncharacterized membrane protein
MSEEKKAQRVYTLEEIKFNEENKYLAFVSCVPFIGFFLLLIEKDDLFVRYMGAQSAIIGAAMLVPILFAFTSIGISLYSVFSLASFVYFVIAIFKTSEGKRFDVPYVSEYALKLMGAI